MEPFVTIESGRWAVYHGRGDEKVTFPASGRGMRALFKRLKCRRVSCSSSVDFPKEEGMTFDSGEASVILTTALSWK